VPEDHLAERPELLEPLDDGQEMVAGKLPDLAGEVDRAIGEQNLGFTDAAGI